MRPALAVIEKEDGAGAQTTLNARAVQAEILRETGRKEESYALALSAFEGLRHYLGPASPSTLKAKAILVASAEATTRKAEAARPKTMTTAKAKAT